MLRRALLLVLLTTGGAFLVMPYVSLYLTRNAAVAESELPLLYLAAGVATLGAVRMIGRMADRHGKARVFVWLALASCLPLLATTLLSPMPLPLIMLDLGLLFVLVPGRMIALMPLLASLPAPASRGSFMSLLATVQMLTIGGAALACSLLLQQDEQGRVLHYWMAGGLALLCNLLAAVLAPALRPVEG